MLLPLSLLFVGAVLTLNGLWMMNRVSDREIVVINLATAFITGTVAVLSMIGADTPAAVKGAALTLLFSLTYLWVGINRLTASDGRGLGWFSLFVAISVLPEAVVTLRQASDPMTLWLGLCWACWAGLWFLYFLLLALRWPLERTASAATLASGILTAWMPALAMLYS
ncbi:AmiS/UreI family transporter [Paracoccus sp. WLY502]|uniref:AmiS/UreI family transporter n=1 Tax=Paracoccus yibinensis TaxID=3068891 RepID=UPI00279651E6|nr:AmiS/UreI family transporter [Paracoccus sp. WLY502]MDQ1900199.1 AmiS/UreI family transporter [Paracoccus sp. WLY502]